MSDPLPTCQRTTYEATPSAIFSQASADGASPSDSPDGPMTDLFGRVVAPVSPSVVRENLGGAIRAIFGQRGITSLNSAALQSSLVNRLKARLPTGGSTLFAMTWSEKATPSGRSVCLLRASAHRTSGNGSGSWPSPKAQNANGAGLHGQGGQDLQTMASWATPTSRDHKDGSSIGTAPENALLGRQVWQTHGQTVPGSLAATAKPGPLNPAFSRWLMGYPPAWDACAGTATPSSRKPLPQSSAPISTSKP